MQLQESGQMYLETILILSKKSNSVRSIDISQYMSFSKPSVSRAVNLLKDGGYILISKEGYITLTALGREIAEKIYERHTILTKCLIALGVSEETAAEDACKIEHDISDESFSAIKRHIIKNLITQI
ncbi:MAG: metal-dependent transcriptional regulator [Ruminococcus sp.]|nr:metal-dependent transcriptional regulator [Ruminococcus sp.]MDD6270453.1 metal-dependent transcriptional regulator [Ruminococcus sp.]MDY4909214.1 metal-dependent transcriptional regulator [Candidatus Fimenecus sp.]